MSSAREGFQKVGMRRDTNRCRIRFISMYVCVAGFDRCLYLFPFFQNCLSRVRVSRSHRGAPFRLAAGENSSFVGKRHVKLRHDDCIALASS